MTDTKRALYITTPIYYVNDSPHIGHAYTTIACDVMARFYRLLEYSVFFLTGTDEHGQKVAKAAAQRGITPQQLTDDVSLRFRNLVATGDNLLNVANDDFIRTTEERHKHAAQELWRRMNANGYIYKANYGGWYAVRDEAYYGESEITTVDGKKFAPTGAEVEWVEEESYFFKLSEFQDRLLQLYDAGEKFVLPQTRLNEVRSFVESGLRDLSISRTSFAWGVPVPDDDKHIMYVWVDALTNYLTATGFPDIEAESYKKFWENGHIIHMVGKDILRFHAVYWPAFLMAADIPLPSKIVAHGWWTIEGEKMSKSLGNVLSPHDMIASAEGIDQLRYFMLKAMPFGNDGDFSKERMIEIINADLANNIGNLAQRCLSMIQKNCAGKIPEFTATQHNLLNSLYNDRWLKYRESMMKFAYHDALAQVAAAAGDLNNYFAENEPWRLRKTDIVKMQNVLYSTIEGLRIVALLLQPYCPNAAGKLLDQLAVSSNERNFSNIGDKFALQAGTDLPPPNPVFPRLQPV